jgi:hypothetical protein
MTTPPSSYSELYARFGDPRESDFEAKYIVRQRYPIAGKLVLIATHRLITIQLHNVFTRLADAKAGHLIKTFDGSFVIRNVRGGTQPSLHSWGLALDFNAALLPLGSLARFDERVIACFAREGFFNGANFNHRKDPQHFQFTKPHSI